MLTTVEQIMQWFEDFGGEKYPYWVLYAGEKRDAANRRCMNWETGDYQTAKTLLKANLERYAIFGGTFNITVSEKGKDNNPAAGTPICFNASSSNHTGAVAMVNGVAVPIQTGGYGQTNYTEIIALNNEKNRLETELQVQKLKAEFELEKLKAEQRINGIGNGLVGWLDSLSKHPQFNPNTPFNMINGIFGMLMGTPQIAANPQGLPEPIQQSVPQQQPVPTQPQQQPNTEGVQFAYNMKEIGMDYHNLCESLQIPLENRNAFLAHFNQKIDSMSMAEKLELASKFQ